jgi:hypothetical protein
LTLFDFDLIRKHYLVFNFIKSVIDVPVNISKLSAITGIEKINFLKKELFLWTVGTQNFILPVPHLRKIGDWNS